MNCKCGVEFRPQDRSCRLCGRERPQDAANVSDMAGSSGALSEFAMSDPAPAGLWLEPTPVPTASGNWYRSAIPLFTLSVVISATVIAGLFHVVTRYVNLFLVFPAFEGVLVGLWLGATIKEGKCRSGVVAAKFGLAAGLLCYGAGMVFEAVQLRPQLVDAMTSMTVQEAKIAPAAARRVAEEMFNPWRTFIVAQQLQAESGVTISSTHGSSSGLPIRGWVYWGVALLELCLLSGLSSGMAAAAANSRFCEKCDVWYRSDVPFKCCAQWTEEMVQNVRSTNWQAAAALGGRSKVKEDHKCETIVHSCPKCGERQVEVKSTTEKKTQKLFHGAVPKEAGERLAAVATLPGKCS